MGPQARLLDHGYRPVIAVRTEGSIVPRLRWYHRWATVDIEWMGLAVDQPRYVGFLTLRRARAYGEAGKAVGISMGIVPAYNVKRRWRLGKHRGGNLDRGGRGGKGGRTEE